MKKFELEKMIGVFLIFLATTSTALGILNGSTVSIAQFPYQAAVEYNDKFYGGATIIGTKWAISSTRLLATAIGQSGELSKLKIRVGTSSVTTPNGTLIGVAKIHKNPFIIPTKWGYDVAVIELQDELEFNELVQPARLPSSESRPLPLETVANVTGWGETRVGDQDILSSVLKVASVFVFNHAECKEIYNDLWLDVTDTILCAQGLDGKVCGRDVGGGLVVDGVVYGVVSYANGCYYHQQKPYLFADVLRQVDFIKSVTGL